MLGARSCRAVVAGAIGVLGVSAALAGAAPPPASAGAAATPSIVRAVPAAASCAPTLPLTGAATSRRELGPGTTLSIWRDPFSAEVTNRRRWLQVSMVRTSLDLTRISVRATTFPGATDPLDLAAEVNALALVNGDFFDWFDTGEGNPRGHVVHDGELLFAPYGRHPVVAQVTRTLPPDEVQRVRGSATVGAVSVPVSIVNGRTLPRRAAGIFDARWTGGQLPQGALALVLRGGKVAGIRVRQHAVPPGARVLVVPASLEASLRRIRIGARVRVTVQVTDGTSSTPRTVQRLEAGTARLDGMLTVGAKSVRIGAWNYQHVQGRSVNVFDQRWNFERTPLGAATIVVRSGRVSAIHRSGASSSVPAVGYVIQIPAERRAFVTGLRVGDAVTIATKVVSDSGEALQEVIGHGSRILQGGVTTPPCFDSAEIRRPRTVLGWNAKGEVFLMTATSGRADTDYWYRTGGARVAELAQWLRDQGATDGINFDGGGSTILAVPGTGDGSSNGYVRADLPPLNWRRTVPNALAIVPR